jgi:peptidoglycan hydrolase CwlO-like protein
LNRGIGSSVATQSVLSVKLVNSEVSTAMAATAVLQLQTQIQDLQKCQEEKIQDLQSKHDSELSDIKARHMSEIKKLHEAIDTIKLHIQELVLALGSYSLTGLHSVGSCKVVCC